MYQFFLNIQSQCKTLCKSSGKVLMMDSTWVRSFSLTSGFTGRFVWAICSLSLRIRSTASTSSLPDIQLWISYKSKIRRPWNIYGNQVSRYPNLNAKVVLIKLPSQTWFLNAMPAVSQPLPCSACCTTQKNWWTWRIFCTNRTNRLLFL